MKFPVLIMPRHMGESLGKRIIMKNDALSQSKNKLHNDTPDALCYSPKLKSIITSLDEFEWCREILKENIDNAIYEIIDAHSVSVRDLVRVSIENKNNEGTFDEKYIVKFGEKEIGTVEIIYNGNTISMIKKIKSKKENEEMNWTGVDLTHEIDKSAAVQMSERSSSKRHNVVCPHCGFEMPTITMKENAVCRGLEMRCKNQACKQLFEIKINTNKIK